MMKNESKQLFRCPTLTTPSSFFSSCHLMEFLPSPCRAAGVIWQRHLTSKVTAEFTLEKLLSYIYPSAAKVMSALSYSYKNMFLC